MRHFQLLWLSSLVLLLFLSGIVYLLGGRFCSDFKTAITPFKCNPAPFQSPNFNKPVYLGKILAKPNAARSPEWVYVAFPKGAYNRWHSHKIGQILIATDGVGLHQIKGGKLI